MNRWIGFFIGASALCLHASVIDYGKIQMQHFVSDASRVVFSIGSTAGNYSISSSVSPVLGGITAPGCLTDVPVGCAFGTYSFSAFFPDFSSFPENGTATLGGSTQDVVFGCAGPTCPKTNLTFTTAPVLIDSIGLYSVSFTVSGVIQASTGPGNPLLINDPVYGIGTMMFVAQSAPNNHFLITANGLPAWTQWTLEPVPEPSTAALSGFSLALLAALFCKRILRLGTKCRQLN
jgi:hypothetical protein